MFPPCFVTIHPKTPGPGQGGQEEARQGRRFRGCRGRDLPLVSPGCRGRVRQNGRTAHFRISPAKHRNLWKFQEKICDWCILMIQFINTLVGFEEPKMGGCVIKWGEPQIMIMKYYECILRYLEGKISGEEGSPMFHLIPPVGGMWVKCWGPSQERIDLLQPIIVYQSCCVKQQYRWYFSVSVICKTKTGNALKIIGELARKEMAAYESIRIFTWNLSSFWAWRNNRRMASNCFQHPTVLRSCRWGDWMICPQHRWFQMSRTTGNLPVRNGTP